MKKAYLSLVVLCLVPFIGVSIIMENAAKENPNAASMMIGPSLIPGTGAMAVSATKV